MDLNARYLVNRFSGPLTTTAIVIPGTTIFSDFGVTTGRVIMSQTQGSIPTIHTATGSDNRTHLGLGNITLVTGWLGHTFNPGRPPSHWGGHTTYRFVFGAAHATPSLGRPALGALGALMGVAAVYVVRRRGASR